MRHEFESLPRFGLDVGLDIEPADLQALMRRIDNTLRPLVAPSEQPYAGHALLNIAVAELLRERGVQETATTLIRVIDAVLEHGERCSLEPCTRILNTTP